MAAKSLTLRTFKATFNGVENGKLPSRLKLFNWGPNKTNQGVFTVDDETARVFAENQSKLAREQVQVDFNHNTVPGTEAFKAAAGSPKIGGYGNPKVIKGDGLYLENVETTPSGTELAADYKDLSPSPITDEQGRVVALHSVALVPAGSVENLTIESAALNALEAKVVTLSVPDSKISDSHPDPKAYRGQQTQLKTMAADRMEMIKHIMDCPDDASYEDVMERLKAHWEGKGDADGDETDGPINPKSDTRVGWEGRHEMKTMAAAISNALESKLTPLAAKLESVTAQLDAERKKADKAHRESVIAQAAKDGKVIPLSAEQLLDTEKFPTVALEAIIANLKPEVPMQTLRVKPLSADGKGQTAKKTMSDSSAAIMAQVNRSTGTAGRVTFASLPASN